MNITKIFLLFLFLIQILFLVGYNYSIDSNIFFSFSSIFDEEFVIMFAMFLVISLLIFFSLQSFSNLFDERIAFLTKFFIDNFDQVLNNINFLLNIFNKSYNILLVNFNFLNLLNDNIIILFNNFELKENVLAVVFSKLFFFKEKIVNDFFSFKI